MATTATVLEVRTEQGPARVDLLAAADPVGAVLLGHGASGGVAGRTAAQSGAVAVLCLAFPLRPPRRSPTGPSQTRQDELDAVRVPTLVVQGAGDPFGKPSGGANITVVIVPGNHSLTTDLEAVGEAVRGWLSGEVRPLRERP